MLQFFYGYKLWPTAAELQTLRAVAFGFRQVYEERIRRGYGRPHIEVDGSFTHIVNLSGDGVG